MGFDTFNKRVQSKLASTGQAEAGVTRDSDMTRNIYAAKVISNSDPFEMGRIVVCILGVDDAGNEIASTDRFVKTENLSYCLPLHPHHHFFMIPFINEMVYILTENPKDPTSVRYWIGPIVSTQANLSGEDFLSAHQVFDHTETNLNPRLKNMPGSNLLNESDVALNGRGDSALILRKRESYLTAGQYINQTNPSAYAINTITPLYLQLIQNDYHLDDPNAFNYSQANLQATSINIYSNLGKFRDPKMGAIYEPANTNLPNLDALTNSLRPVPFGDELVKCLDLIIKTLLAHTHTIQRPLLTNALSKQLSEYTIDGKLQDLLSKYVRIN